MLNFLKFPVAQVIRSGGCLVLGVSVAILALWRCGTGDKASTSNPSEQTPSPTPSNEQTSKIKTDANGKGDGTEQTKTDTASSAAGSLQIITAHFVSGATGAATALHGNPLVAGVPENGTWRLSPNKVMVKVKSLKLTGGATDYSGEVSCSVTFDRAKPGLTSLADCPFKAPLGTYTGLEIILDGNFDVTVNDTTNGFYSTATGIVVQAPAGGPTTYTVKRGYDKTNNYPLKKPLVIAEGLVIDAYVVINALQFLPVIVSSGTVAMADVIQLPSMLVSVEKVAKITFYVNQGINTIESYCVAAGCTHVTQGPQWLALFYLAADKPFSAAIDFNGSPDFCAPLNPPDSSLPDYMGVDVNHVIGWTSPSSSYKGMMFRMAEVTNISGTTNLYCKKITADPAPPGGSFASGAPDIALDAYKLATMVLLAK